MLILTIFFYKKFKNIRSYIYIYIYIFIYIIFNLFIIALATKINF